LGLFVGLVFLKMYGRVPGAYLPIVKLLVLAGAIGTALSMVAMEYFLFAFDRSSAFKKLVCFCIITRFPLPGAALYCFFVYSRSELVKVELLEHSSSSSA